MPAILNLKFKGNKSFVAFSNLNDSEALTKTWKVCTKVASFLEQGQRLENLSWRLWHLQNLMVDTDNAKSKREFKKLSKCMGDKLDKEKGRSIEELEAPDYKRTPSSEMIRQRAAEKERYREQNAKPGTIKRMQFTFSVDQPSAPGANLPVKKPDLRPSPEFTKRTRAATRAQADDSTLASSSSAISDDLPSLKFDSIFNQGFGPSALLFPAPTLTTRLSYGEGLNPSTDDTFTVSRPTIELPLDEILNTVDSPPPMPPPAPPAPAPQQQQDVVMRSVPTKRRTRKSSVATRDDGDSDQDTAADTTPFASALKSYTPLSQAVKESETVAPSKLNPLFSTSVTRTNPNTRPTLTVKTQTSARSSGPGATATSLNPSTLRSSNSSGAPGGVKAECSNCGATHTPLWRRGLNDELNCNACGLYCKLHKRPRPKSMRNSHGGSGGGGSNNSTVNAAVERPLTVSNASIVQSVTHGIGGGSNSRQDPVDVLGSQTAQCYNCNTTATPLWRKDDEGKTVCNACGLYYKLHGSPRPISMKSDVIRKRSRHDARRGSNAASSAPGNTNNTNTNTSIEDTQSTSPTASRRTSPIHDHDPPSPILAPDSSTSMSGPNSSSAVNVNATTTLAYDYTQDGLTDAFGTTQSELVGALGQDQTSLFQNTFQFQYPGPYHPDYLLQMYTAHMHGVGGGVSTTSGGGGAGNAGASPDLGNVDLSSPSSSVGGHQQQQQQHGMQQQQHHHTTSPDDLDLPLMSPRLTKRRRMSIDSCIEEPPVSAVSWYSPESSSVSLNGGGGGGTSSSSSGFPFGNTFGTTTTKTTGSGSGGQKEQGLGLIGISHHHHSQQGQGQHHHHSLSQPEASTSSHLLLHSSNSSNSSSSSGSSSSSSPLHQQQQQQQHQQHSHSHSLSHLSPHLSHLQNSHSHSHSHSSHHHHSLSHSLSNSHTHTGGPALRGSGNTFWHPPMMPLSDEQFHEQFQQQCQPQSQSQQPQNQPQQNQRHGGILSRSPYLSSSSGSKSSSSPSSDMDMEMEMEMEMEIEEDSPMDYIHGSTTTGSGSGSGTKGLGSGTTGTGIGTTTTTTTTTVIQDDESLFSAYLNHHPATPDEGGGEVVV